MSWSLYLSALAPSIVKSGLSAGYGSGYCPPTLKPATGLVMPPSHAGMVPAALPAFSAPTGVRVVPSLAMSAADISAAAGMARAAPTASSAADFFGIGNMGALLLLSFRTSS